MGGGPAGAAAAVTAQEPGMDVTLYSAGPDARMRPGESLPPGGQELVREVFGHVAFRPERHLAAYANRSTWGSGELETADFVFNPFGNGWHLDRAAFDADLLAAVRERGVRVVEGRARDVRARFVIDASGRSASVARARGAKRVRLDRLVAVFRPDAGSAELTVTAAENGWSYTAPGIAAFLTDADLLAATAGLVTDASTSYLDRIVGPGWLAAGDAAVAFDPLSSQGIVTAVLMGRMAGRVAAGLEDPAQYVEAYGDVLREHRALKQAYYELETRWPGSPFWARRQGTGAALSV